ADHPASQANDLKQACDGLRSHFGAVYGEAVLVAWFQAPDVAHHAAHLVLQLQKSHVIVTALYRNGRANAVRAGCVHLAERAVGYNAHLVEVRHAKHAFALFLHHSDDRKLMSAHSELLSNG